MTAPSELRRDPDGQTPYQYVVLRFVPRVDREEFVNVGVVVYAQSADLLRAAWHLDEPRLRALAPKADLAQLADQLRTVADVCAGVGDETRRTLDNLGRRFGWLAAPRSTSLQPGGVHGGLATDIDSEPDRLLTRLVR